jgi:hypothetical protein
MPTPTPAIGYELRFPPVSGAGRALAFSCDAQGQVDLDALSPRARHHYFYARTLIGREFRRPTVWPAAISTARCAGTHRSADTATRAP